MMHFKRFHAESRVQTFSWCCCSVLTNIAAWFGGSPKQSPPLIIGPSHKPHKGQRFWQQICLFDYIL